MSSVVITLEMALERCLAEQFGKPYVIKTLKRTPSEYRSSFAIENLHVVFEDSSELEVVFKNLSNNGLLPQARVIKPAFIHNPLREISTYDRILSSAGLGTAACYGSVADAAGDCYWLFLERIRGVELYQIGDLTVWQAAAEWLARLHTRLNTELQLMRSRCHLLNYDEDFYGLWLTRARRFCPKPDVINRIADRYGRVIERLLALPLSFIHGEFYASNVICGESSNRWRIVPIDWEMAAIGPRLMDVAALISGNWSEEERRQIALAYFEATGNGLGGAQSAAEFIEAVEYCRLHLCMQWLGWAPQWAPPKEHAHDWLEQAVNIAERLGM